MIIIAAILAIFVYGMIAAMLGTLLPSLSSAFSLTPAQNGYIALAQGLGLAIASVSVGPLIDNKGKKTGLLLGLSLVAVSLFVHPHEFPQLVLRTGRAGHTVHRGEFVRR